MAPRAASWLIEQLSYEAVVTPGPKTLMAAAARRAADGLPVWGADRLRARRRRVRVLTEDARLLGAVTMPGDGVIAIEPVST
jgi:hypothetical protein